MSNCFYIILLASVWIVVGFLLLHIGTHLNVGESYSGINHVEERDLNFDRKSGRKLHVDEIFQFLNISFSCADYVIYTK